MSVKVIDNGRGGILKKVGDVCLASYDGVEYKQVGSIKKFEQIGRSKSLRLARLSIKRMLSAVISE